MKKNNIIILIVVIILIIAIATAIIIVNNKNNNDIDVPNPKVSVPYNERYNTEYIIDTIKNEEQQLLTEEQMKELIDLGEYNRLEKVAISQITDDTIKEVWLIKVEELEQDIDLSSLFINRLITLTNQYSENEKLTAILTNSDCVKVQQRGGIFIFIIAENANEIDEKISEGFNYSEIDSILNPKVEDKEPEEGYPIDPANEEENLSQDLNTINKQ